MLKEDIIKHFGSASAVARAFGISKQAVHRWPRVVPPLRALQAEALTQGALKADPSILQCGQRPPRQQLTGTPDEHA